MQKKEQFNQQIDLSNQDSTQKQYPFNSIEEAEESLEQTPSIKLKSTLMFRNLENQQGSNSMEIDQFTQNPKFSNFHQLQITNTNKQFDLNKVFDQIQNERKEKTIKINMQYKERIQNISKNKIQNDYFPQEQTDSQKQLDYQNTQKIFPSQEEYYQQDIQYQENQDSPIKEHLKNSNQLQKILFRQVESPDLGRKKSQKESQVIDRFRNDKNILEQMQQNQLQKSDFIQNLSEFDLNNMEQQAQLIEELNFRKELKPLIKDQNIFQQFKQGNQMNKQVGNYQIFDLYNQEKQIENFKEVERSLQNVQELMNSNMAFSQIQQNSNSKITNQQSQQEPVIQTFQAKKIYTSLEQFKQPIQNDQYEIIYDDQQEIHDSTLIKQNIQQNYEKKNQSQRNSQIEFIQEQNRFKVQRKSAVLKSQVNDLQKQSSSKTFVQNSAPNNLKDSNLIQKKNISWINLSVINRNQIWTNYKKENLQILKEQNLCQEKLTCTFNPKTNTNKTFSNKKMNFLNGVNYKIECYNNNEKYNDKNFHNQVKKINSYQQLHEFKKVNGFDNLQSQNQSTLKKSIDNSSEQFKYGTSGKKQYKGQIF